MLRAGIAHLINAQPDLQVCFESTGPAPVLDLIERERPDVLISDLTMPGGNGLGLLREIKARFPQVRVLIYSMHDEAIYAERVVRAGADGYVMKSLGGDHLLAAIRRVLGGQLFLSEPMWSQMVATMSGKRSRRSKSPIDKLTDREFQVLELVGRGMTTREVAAQLRISPKTVDVHRGRLRHKLDLRDATALMRYAVRWTEVMSV